MISPVNLRMIFESMYKVRLWRLASCHATILAHASTAGHKYIQSIQWTICLLNWEITNNSKTGVIRLSFLPLPSILSFEEEQRRIRFGNRNNWFQAWWVIAKHQNFEQEWQDCWKVRLNKLSAMLSCLSKGIFTRTINQWTICKRGDSDWMVCTIILKSSSVRVVGTCPPRRRVLAPPATGVNLRRQNCWFAGIRDIAF